MNQLLKFLTCFFVATCAVAHAQTVVTLQDFSTTVTGNTFYYGTWEKVGNAAGSTDANTQFIQGVGVYDITGSGVFNDANSKIEFFNTPNLSIGTDQFISVNAKTLPSNVATAFFVQLLDANGKKAFAPFATSSFTGAYTSVTASLTFDSGFDSTLIDSMIITGDQPSGTSLFNVSFNSISAVPAAVPEPSTYAGIMGLASLAVGTFFRRKTKR